MTRRAALAVLALAAALVVPASGALAQRPQQVPLVRIPFPQDERNLTPYTFERGYPLMTLVYDTLMWRDARGVPRPWLARSVRRSAGGRSVVIELHRGLRWHDGRPLTADDVAFTFDFVSRRPHPRFTPQLEAVESVEAVASDRAVIRLEHPSLGFLDQPLADLPILPRHIWEGLPPDRLAPAGLPVGSGPYRLVEHEPGERYLFRSNNSYFRGRPAVAGIAVPILRRANEMTAALEEHRVDALPVPLTPTAADRLDDSPVEVVQTASYAGTVLMLNTRRPPFDRPEGRRAIARALDLDRIALATSETPGTPGAVAADRGYLHPASQWALGARLDGFDPTRARVALIELGFPPLRILAPAGDELRLEAGRQVVLALRRAGARARLVELAPRDLAAAVGQDGSTATFQAAIWTSPALASYDPDYLRVVFGDGAPLNYSGYASSTFDRLAERVAAAPTARRRRAAVAAQLRRLARDVPVIPLLFFDGRFAYWPAVHDGWVPVRGTGILDKRSFIRTSAPAAAAPAGEGDPLAPATRDPGFELGAFGIAALVLAGALALALVANLAGRLARR